MLGDGHNEHSHQERNRAAAPSDRLASRQVTALIPAPQAAAANMTTLAGAFGLFGAVSLVLGTPLFLVARSTGRADAALRFAGGAVLVGLICALLEFSSERLVSQCLATGKNPAYACIDFGSDGFQLLAVGGYAIVAWLTALALWRR